MQDFFLCKINVLIFFAFSEILTQKECQNGIGQIISFMRSKHFIKSIKAIAGIENIWRLFSQRDEIGGKE